MEHKTAKKASIYFLMVSILACISFGLCGQKVSAAHENVYTCKITRTYQHPVTGKIEDSAGGSSKATGQGMVEGSVFSKGLLEVTDKNEYYLTFRMSLIDYTSKHSFSVQKRGESSWTKQSVVQTGTGKDNNGKTTDLRICLNSQDSIIRCSMYVQPMGRNVIFYFYPGDFTKGNTSGMKANIVNAASKKKKAATQAGTATQSQATTKPVSETTTEQATSTTQTYQTTQETVLDNAQGLSLSTEPNTISSNGENTSDCIGMKIFILTISMTISGLILLFVAVGMVWYFRKNWERWGNDKDEYDEIYNKES